MNRTPTNQTGTRKYFKDNSIGGLEFLLANDIDNSNPAVQAEQLNWLHFMMNIGSTMPMTQQLTLMVCVSMPWTMWMPTFSKSHQTTSKQPMVWTSLKPMPSNTYHIWKLGLPTTHTTTRTLREHNFRLIMPFVNRPYQPLDA